MTWRQARRSSLAITPAVIVTGACALATALILLALLVLGAVRVEAHPGRLDERGCHEVRHDFQYSDGRVAKKGDAHCHRVLGIGAGVRLDGTESLQDGRHDHEDPPDEQTYEGEHN